MKELLLANKEITMTSLEVCNLINRFRIEEGKPEKQHYDFLKIIRKEIKDIESVGISIKGKFSLSSYSDGTREYTMYKLDKFAIMMLANRESALVRYRTQEYIEALENRLQTIQQQQIISEKDKQIKRLEALIGLRTKDKFQYGKIIKNHLGIRKANKDYENIKAMFFYELKVNRWEDITYNRQNVVLLNSICESYIPSEQISLF